MIYMYYCVSPLLTYALYFMPMCVHEFGYPFYGFFVRIASSDSDHRFWRPSFYFFVFSFSFSFCLLLRSHSSEEVKKSEKGERTIFPPSHIPLILPPPNIRMHEIHGFRIYHEGALHILLFPFCPLYSHTQTTNKFFFHSFHYFLPPLSLFAFSFVHKVFTRDKL